MFFQFKVITDGGTTYYSPDGRTLHRLAQLSFIRSKVLRELGFELSHKRIS